MPLFFSFFVCYRYIKINPFKIRLNLSNLRKIFYCYFVSGIQLHFKDTGIHKIKNFPYFYGQKYE